MALNQQRDIAWIPGTGLPVGQHLSSMLYGWPGCGNWLAEGNFSHTTVADSGSNLYNKYNSRFKTPAINITVSG